MNVYFISFADPKSEQFIHAILVRAESPRAALGRASELEANPSGSHASIFDLSAQGEDTVRENVGMFGFDRVLTDYELDRAGLYCSTNAPKEVLAAASEVAVNIQQ